MCWRQTCGSCSPGSTLACTRPRPRHHFARPGNRFWPALHAAGFTARQLHPSEQESLLDLGLGITNVAARATARADELSAGELAEGGQILAAKVRDLRPRWLAVLGVTAYRTAFNRPKAIVGPQPEQIEATSIWVLPNPSGLNAHWSAPALAEAFAAATGERRRSGLTR